MMKWFFIAAAVAVSAVPFPVQGQPQTDSGTTSAVQTTTTENRSSATLSEKFAAVGDANSGIGEALQKAEEAEAFIEAAKDKIPRNKLPMYFRIIKDATGSTTSSEELEDTDTRSTKTKARIKRALRKRDEFRKRLEEGVF